MPPEQNPYAAPVSDDAVQTATTTGPSLLARLWMVGLAATASYGGVVALGARALAWSPDDPRPELLGTLLAVHFNMMVLATLTGALMSCTVLAAIALGRQRSTAATRLGLVGWAAWLLAVLCILFAGTAGVRPVPALLALALGSTVVSVAGDIADARSTPTPVRLVRALAVCCAAPAIAYAMHTLEQLRANTLLSWLELIAVAASLAVAVLGTGSASGTQVGRIYRFAGALPSALIALGLAGVLAMIGAETRLSETLVATAKHHASGSALLCAVMALAHDNASTLARRGFREWPARVVAAAVSLGFVATTVAMYLLGTRGMPLRYATCIPTMMPYQRLLTVAAFATAAALVMVPLVALLPTRMRKSRSARATSG